MEGDFKISIERKEEQEESEGEEERGDEIGRGKGRGKERKRQHGRCIWYCLEAIMHDSSNNKPRELV